jgi:hypothetical protein
MLEAIYNRQRRGEKYQLVVEVEKAVYRRNHVGRKKNEPL